MRKITLIIFPLIFIIFAQISFANVDPFNTYRWNRANVLNNTNQIEKTPWFEWWYYKVVIPETGESFFFVYGIVNPWDSEHTLPATRAYVEMGDFNSREQIEHIVSLDRFHAAYDKTEIEVDGQLASDKNIRGDIQSEAGNNYRWDISINKHWSFNATGWATGMGVTNIEWYPAQADATCNGTIESNGKLYHLVDAPCYQDRNWGSAFPKWWTWIVSNDFNNFPETALAIGGGHPKYFGTNFPLKGVSVGLKHRGKTYEFRPNDLDKVRIDINFGKWEVAVENFRHKLEISAYAPKEDFMDLQFMTPQGDIFHDFETLTGKLTVKIYENQGLIVKRWKLKETIYSDRAGIEYGSRDIKKMFELKLR